VQEERLQRIASCNGIEVYCIRMEKFKTNSINIFFQDDLSRENASKNALVPAVLRRGCEKLPTFRDIALRLEELYGMSFDCGVTKKGERQIIQFSIEHISDTYADKDAGLFENAFELITEIIARPVLENGVFKAEYVEQEKENLKRLIESRINDKIQYSVDRCYEVMCKDEPFGIYDYGSIEDLEPINPENLYRHYLTMLETFPVKVFITGNADESKIEKALKRLFGIKRGGIKNIGTPGVFADVKNVRNVTEKLDVNQGKLCLGFRTNTSPDSSGYYGLLVYNGILGGGVHSKLFQNVREKAGLAYYVFSRLEKFKGLMVIGSGIEADNRDRALEIIMEQLDEIRKGNISEYEYESTLKTIETGIKSLRDNQYQVVDFYLSQITANTEDTFDTLIEKVRRVTRTDIINAAAGIKLDTIYFLAPAESGRGE